MIMNNVTNSLDQLVSRFLDHHDAIQPASKAFYDQFEHRRNKDFDVLLQVLQNVNEARETIDMDRNFRTDPSAAQRILTKLNLVGDTLNRVVARSTTASAELVTEARCQNDEDMRQFVAELEETKRQMDLEYEAKVEELASKLDGAASNL